MTTEAFNYLRAGLRDLGKSLPAGWDQTLDTVAEFEFSARLQRGVMEVGAQDGLASVALDGALLDDLPLKTIRDAERILAACDAIILGNVKTVRSRKWLVPVSSTVFKLTTRGFDEPMIDRAIGMSRLRDAFRS